MNTKYLTLIIVSLSLLFSGCDPVSDIINDEKKTSNSAKETTSNSNTVTQNSTPITNNTGNLPLKQINILAIVDVNDAGTKNGTTQTKIDHFMAVTNQVFQNSTVPAKVNVVKVQPYTFSQQNSKDALSTIYHDQTIASIRNSVHADIVVIYRNNANDGVCGVAYLNKNLDSNVAYAHVSLKCPSTTTAHEIGHTMGLAHSTKKTSTHGHTSYGHGYGVEGEFSTIMSYKSTYHTGVRVFNYSSPNLECQGYECGVPNVADSVTALQNSIARVASFK